MTEEKSTKKGFRVTRREFLKLIPPSVASALAAWYLPKELLAFTYVEPINQNLNPLETYPNRDWEKVYRDLYSYDSVFHYLCAPNDTHGCLLKAAVKNGVVKWIDPSFGYHKTTDIYGNSATARWDPRICVSGVAYLRRFYSADRRVKGAFIRNGFKAWVDAGFPRDSETGSPPKEYFEGRGKEDWTKVSWDEAFKIIAKSLINVTKTYSENEGANRLEKQGYAQEMIDTMQGAGTQTVKVRGGMPHLGVRRIVALYRFANSLALLDSWIRGVDPSNAKGGRGWDNYAWHTDLPPGHPMVCGHKTSDFDLYTAENAKVITTWGKNWIATKMVDAHWLTEARLHGAKIITITTEYQSTSNKADEVIVIRPATDTALALGLAYVIIMNDPPLYDEDFVKQFSDLPFLVRMDTLKLLKAKDIIPGYTPKLLDNYIKTGETPPTDLTQQAVQYVSQELRDEWDDFVLWDLTTNSEKVVTRDDVGEHFSSLGIDPALEGTYEITLEDGITKVNARPVFDLIKQYLMDNCDPVTISEVTGAPKEAIENLAQTIAANPGRVLFTTGMGPNHYWNADLKDRAIFLVATLTGNEGHFGGEVGSYAGNYRMEIFSGVPQWAVEDPFNIELDSTKLAKVKKYLEYESAHYYNYGDRPLKVGNKLFTGSTHMPTPTKVCWWANTNSILGNAKWAYDVIVNTLPKIEMIIVQEWYWTMTCEYADIVLGVDSWPERKIPDIYGACTNPFFQVAPDTPLERMFDTKDDMEMQVEVSKKLAVLTGDERFKLYWKFAIENMSEVYIDRIIKASSALKGYKFETVLKSCKNGTPVYTLTRTSPRIVGWEQTHESKPWYTKTGRLEFYREEDEFIDAGENMPVWRETVDSTFYEPAVIMAKDHPAIKPKGPEAYGIDPDDLSTETRQVRNVVKPWSDLKNTSHPLMKDGYTHIMYQPKYRHAAHTSASTADIEAVFFGPFGDFYRHDKRKPHVSEGYVDINPLDAKELGIEDGDYIWVDADPSDRPFRGWQNKPEEYKVMRWLVRARYYPNIRRKTARAWFHMYLSTHGSVEGHETRKDKLAKNPRTGYQALYRYGGHQSAVRAWLKPTLMTDSLVRKEYFGQVIGKGFEVDVHTVVGSPKESFVKITKAEPGEPNGQIWQPAADGFRPTYENAAMKKFLSGDYVTIR